MLCALKQPGLQVFETIYEGHQCQAGRPIGIPLREKLLA